jgi:hypothetical protein
VVFARGGVQESAVLLVSFHGGSTGVANVHAYGADGTLLTPAALATSRWDASAELRGLVYDPTTETLYVANGAKGSSEILSFDPPTKSGKPHVFTEASPFLAASFASGKFETSVGHPYSMAAGPSGDWYVSNQDTNCVTRVQAAADGKTATLPAGCQSEYLAKQVKHADFLDGTFVASRIGALADIDPTKVPTDAPEEFGGLQVKLKTGTTKVQHSVRDVAVHGGVLFVCDEAALVVRLYRIADGRYLGASAPTKDAPTHLTIVDDWLCVSAGPKLLGARLSESPTTADLVFTELLSHIAPGSLGASTFDPTGRLLYVVSQTATGKTGSGTIWCFEWKDGSPPKLGHQHVLGPKSLPDTPEFIIHLADQ